MRPREVLFREASIGDKRVADSDARNDLSVIEIFRQQLRRDGLLSGGNDHAVPEGQLPGFADLRCADHRGRGDRKMNPTSVSEQYYALKVPEPLSDSSSTP